MSLSESEFLIKIIDWNRTTKNIMNFSHFPSDYNDFLPKIKYYFTQYFWKLILSMRQNKIILVQNFEIKIRKLIYYIIFLWV